MAASEDLPVRGDAADAIAVAGAERAPGESRGSRRRRFVAAPRHDRSATTVEADIPLLSDIVLPAAPSAAPVVAPQQALAGQRAELAAALVDALSRRLAEGLPMLVETSMAETAGHLRQAIESMLAAAANDFSAAHETLASTRAQAVTGSADASTAGSAGDPEHSSHPV